MLKKKAKEIDQNYKDLPKLIEDMFETMYEAKGVGLAAPQIGLSIRLFVVDAAPMDDNLKNFKKVFINPVMIEEKGDEWPYEEGCLSIPGIRYDVQRPFKLKMEYFDENWNKKTEEFEGIAARVIQHEYDHIEGILFVDYLPALKKKLLKGKLANISKGKVDVDYRMKFPLK